MSRDTIFALSSGALPSAVALIRLSGPQALAAAAALAGTALPLPRTAGLRQSCDPVTGERLDRALILIFPGPASFTGEDVAELQVTGGPALVDHILAHLSRQPGLRHAEPGEFARRALSAGKLDLTEAEGLAALIDAETEAQRSQAMMAAGGSVREQAEEWRARLNSVRARIEADLDFADAEDDVAASLGAGVRMDLSALIADIERVLAHAAAARRVRSGFFVAIVGPPNAGKSTLLNALSRTDAAIVSDVAGTTRDIIEVPMQIGGQKVTLVDTAGLRETENEVEAEGVRRAAARARSADVVVRLGGHGDGFPHEIHVHAKCDLGRSNDGRMHVSARTGEGLAALLSAISVKLAALAPPADLSVTSDRQAAHLRDCAAELALAHEEDDTILTAEHLRRAADALGRLTGRLETEAMLDAVFSRFCVGK